MKPDQRMMVRTPTGEWSAPEITTNTDEAHLQQMLAEQSSWIPGVDDPAYTAREFPTIAGPIDVCIVASDGGLTVVECKLASNTEKRRMVVGQVIDYASAIWLDGPQDFIRRWKARTGDDLGELLTDSSMDRLVESIQTARIDLCLAVDEIDADLRRLIEFLNNATRSDVRVTAIQLAYAKQGDVEILVPSTFGAELADTKVRAAGRSVENWTIDSFIEALETESDRGLARHLFDLAAAATGPGRLPPLWFGNRPHGGIYLHPGGVSHAPAWLWVNSNSELTICGTWRTYRSLAHHPAYSPLAQALGQDHTSGAQGVLVASLNLDEFWPVLVECGRALDQERNGANPDDAPISD